MTMDTDQAEHMRRAAWALSATYVQFGAALVRAALACPADERLAAVEGIRISARAATAWILTMVRVMPQFKTTSPDVAALAIAEGAGPWLRSLAEEARLDDTTAELVVAAAQRGVDEALANLRGEADGG